ncbi:tyrosine-type recombinase/integrase [Cytobacillus oceanisediminis]|uniref:tyrosine-type recombinase/integrase n=1 Tax=Cytobacillus oceanisediminis TaxID=665099 RepID=UPI00254F019F|nr:tyrosine-type recombinase/integrase [Cytobacillus oceanisediminis]MDK7668680.1 tyrosine-type recombinase/integrase [Cytobacillus oceanisediminis]
MSKSEQYWQSTHEDIPHETRNILNQYLLSLKLANKAEATIIKYRWILERFFCGCSVSLKEMRSEDVLKWLNVFSEGKKPKTIDLLLSCLSSFFQFCQEEEYLEKLLIKKRWRPKIPNALPRYLTEQEYARVKLAAESLPLRNRALILFLFSSGCRRSEVSNLNIQDVDLERRTAEVKGKGNKIRKVHFTEECALVLKDYLKTRSYQEGDPLFINSKGQRFLPHGIYSFTTRFGNKIGMAQSLHPHSFRHTFATNMLARGAEIEFIADEMGHSNLNTTRIYARIPTEEMMLAYQNKMG